MIVARRGKDEAPYFRAIVAVVHILVKQEILFDETLRQSTLGGTPFAEHLQAQGIIPGIKVDAGAKALAGHGQEKD